MADMQPVQFVSTPAYSSPDGEGEGLVMTAIDDAPDAPSWDDPDGAGEMKAADWVTAIEGAEDQESLDKVLEAYAETGKDYKTVAEAAEAKQEALDA